MSINMISFAEAQLADIREQGLFKQERALVSPQGASIRAEVAVLPRRIVRRREESERPVDTEVIVVDRFWQVRDLDAPYIWQHVLHLVDVVRRLECVIPAYGDKRVDLVSVERRVDSHKPCVLHWVRQILDRVYRLTGVRPGCTEDDILAITYMRDIVAVQASVIFTLDHRTVCRVAL